MKSPSLHWSKISAGHLWHARSSPDGPLIGFIKSASAGCWDCFLVMPLLKWPDRDRQISTSLRFQDAKKFVEQAAHTEDPFRPLLAAFIADARDLPPLRTRTRWIETGLAKVYVRKACHMIGGRAFTTLDIAQIEVYKKRQGTWKAMLATAQELCPWEAVYIENVHSNILHAHLERLRLADPRWITAGQCYGWVKRQPITLVENHDQSPGV